METEAPGVAFNAATIVIKLSKKPFSGLFEKLEDLGWVSSFAVTGNGSEKEKKVAGRAGKGCANRHRRQDAEHSVSDRHAAYWGLQGHHASVDSPTEAKR